MARKRDRIFALVMAMAFLITTVGVSVAVILQIVQDTKEDTTSVEEVKKMKDFTPITTVDKLETTDLKPGTGEEVKAGDRVTVDYTGAVAATGVVFESSLDSGQQATFGLNEVIPGWRDGLVGMKVGGTRRLLIPAEQAYGANPPAGSIIPANAPLVFDVILHSISDK